MNSSIIAPILTEIGKKIGLKVSQFEATDAYYQTERYNEEDIPTFAEILSERASRVKMTFVVNAINKSDLASMLRRLEFTLLTFLKDEQGKLQPLLLYPCEKSDFEAALITEKGLQVIAADKTIIDRLYTYSNQSIEEYNGAVLMITAFASEGLIVDDVQGGNLDKVTPFKRLLRLLRPEGKDIAYIYIYAIVIGLINLSLPLGIQAIIGLISGGLIFNSVIVLIALVILGILIGGGLQIMQISLVEVLQRRVFAKAAYEFAYRIPRWCYTHLNNHYPPEITNRFFDVITVQKGLPKLLIDLTAAVLQIVFGLLLLSLYHPFFVFFGLFLLGLLVLVFYFTGSKGLETSLVESKYKYRIANWLQEMARAIIPFKMAGDTALPMKRTDELVNSYLKYRKKHFQVLVNQYGFIVAFKTIITGGLLIIGTILVVDRQITLGQFVASEIVIVLIVNAVEKVIVAMDVVYDTLTGVEKIGNATDLVLERRKGYEVINHNGKNTNTTQGLEVEVSNLQFSYPGGGTKALHGVDFKIAAGSTVAFIGHSNSGKNTIIRLLMGLYYGFEGVIMYNGLSLRDLSLPHIRKLIGENILNNVVYDSSVMDNITMGRAEATADKVANIIKKLGIREALYSNPNGLTDAILTGKHQLSESAKYKLTLARALVTQPKLVIIDDSILTLPKAERLELLDFLFDKQNAWTLICVSNEEDIINRCQQKIHLKEGKVIS